MISMDLIEYTVSIQHCVDLLCLGMLTSAVVVIALVCLYPTELTPTSCTFLDICCAAQLGAIIFRFSIPLAPWEVALNIMLILVTIFISESSFRLQTEVQNWNREKNQV